jgi:hypothetical protein
MRENRYQRPSWSTGLFVALACTVAALGGLMMFTEGKKVKKIEGVPTPVAHRVDDSEALVFEKKHKSEKKIVNGGAVVEKEVSK